MPNRIREIRESKGLSGEKLGKLIGVGRAMISKLENGTAKLTQGYIEKLVEVLGCTPDEILGRELHKKPQNIQNISPMNRVTPSSITKIPVYGAAGAGSPERIILTEDNIVEYDDMPPELESVKNGFRMYVSGDSMEPRHYAGEKVSVHPYKKLAIGQDCVVVEEPDGNALIKRYMGETETHYKLSQYNPPKSFTLKKTDVRAIYAVVR